MRRFTLFCLSTLLIACGGSDADSMDLPEQSQSLRIEGSVMRGQLSNAVVSIDLSGQNFTTQADADGKYSLQVAIPNLDELFVMRAKGQGAESHIELVNVLGVASQLQDLAGEDNTLSYADTTDTNITLLDTARYLLAVDKNDEREITSDAEWQHINQQLRADEVLTVAAFLKLLSDKQDVYPLPNDDTLLSFANSDTSLSTRTAYYNYLRVNELANEWNATLKPSFSHDLEQAKSVLVQHQDIRKPLTAGDLQGRFIVERVIPLLGATPNSTDSVKWLTFSDSDNTGSSNVNTLREEFNNQFIWSLIVTTHPI